MPSWHCSRTSGPPVQPARARATSVLPTPASPSRSSGRPSRRARKTAVASPSSARYPCRAEAGASTSSTVAAGPWSCSPTAPQATPSHGIHRPPGLVRAAGMDLGISGRTAAVAAGSAGPGLASAARLAADGVRVAICGRDQDRLDGAVESLAAGRRRPRRPRRRRVDAGRRDRLRRRGHRRPRRAARHPRHQRRRSTAGHLRLDADRRLRAGARPQPALGRRHVPGRGAAHAGAGLGPGGRHHVDLGEAADRHADPVQHGPGRRHRLPQDPRHRGRGRRA